MRWLVLGVWLLMAGCATFESSPEEVQQKLSDPTRGHLYERDPLAKD